MLGLIVATALANTTGAPAAPPPNPCIPKESCRYIDTIELAGPDGPQQVKAGWWAPYIQDNGVRVFLGETVVVRLAGDGKGGKRPVVLYAGRAKDLPRGSGDEVAERKFTEMQKTQKTETLGVLSKAEHAESELKAEKDTVRFTLSQPAGESVVVLRVDNGYGALLHYRAQMGWTDGRDRNTNVCPVRDIPSYETWSDPIVTMKLSDFELSGSLEARGTLQDCQ